MPKKIVTQATIDRLKKVVRSPGGQEVIAKMRRNLEYAPDLEFAKVERAEDDPICYVGDFIEKVKKNPKRYRIDARLYETSPKTGKHKLVNVTETTKFMERVKLEESRGMATRRLLEGGDWDTGSRGTTGRRVGSEFIQLLGGPYSRQLYWYDYLLQNAQAFEAKNHNPLAKFIVSTITDFTLGKGLTIETKDQKTQNIIDDFWKRNKMSRRMRVFSDELTTYGEIMSRKFIVPKIGTSVRAVDPSTVWEIVTEPDDIESVYYYHQQYPTRYQLFMGAPPTGAQKGPKTTYEYIIRQVPADQMRHYKINAVSNEARGRSDLFAILGWLKRLKDYLTYRVVKAKNEAAFLWDVAIDGSPADVAAYAALINPNVEAGSSHVHNKAIEIKPISPTVGRSARDETADWLINMISVGARIPVEYLGIIAASTGGSRAGAIVGTEPIAKMVQARQLVYEEMVIDLLTDEFAEHGIKELPEDLEVTFPEVMTSDRTAKIGDLIKAEGEQWISKRRAATIGAKELQITNYDYDDEKVVIDEEVEDERDAMDSAIQLWPRVVPGQGGASPSQLPGQQPGKSAPGRGKDMTGPGKAKIKNQAKRL